MFRIFSLHQTPPCTYAHLSSLLQLKCNNINLLFTSNDSQTISTQVPTFTYDGTLGSPGRSPRRCLIYQKRQDRQPLLWCRPPSWFRRFSKLHIKTGTEVNLRAWSSACKSTRVGLASHAGIFEKTAGMFPGNRDDDLLSKTSSTSLLIVASTTLIIFEC